MFCILRAIFVLAVVLPSGCDLHKQSKESGEPTLVKPILAIVIGDHCGACVRQKPTQEKLRKLGNVHVFDVNVNKEGQEKYKKLWNIKAIPTYIYWEKDPNKPTWRTNSAKDALAKLTKKEE